jgi:hypothetical protein
MFAQTTVQRQGQSQMWKKVQHQALYANAIQNEGRVDAQMGMQMPF